MKPTDYFGKSSTIINAQIVQLSRFMVTKEEFGDRVTEVTGAVETVISQLQLMQTSAEQIELVEKVEDDKKTESEEANKEEPEPTGMLCGTYEKEPVDDLPIEQTPEEPTTDAMETKVALEQVIRGFLELCSNSKGAVNDFGNLLIADDPMLNAEALDNIRTRFIAYMGA